MTPGLPSKPSCLVVARLWSKAEPASRGTMFSNCGNSSLRWFLCYSTFVTKSMTQDLKQLGVKKLYGKFCSGNINHICIKTLQVNQHKRCFAMTMDWSQLHLCYNILSKSCIISQYENFLWIVLKAFKLLKFDIFKFRNFHKNFQTALLKICCMLGVQVNNIKKNYYENLY